ALKERLEDEGTPVTTVVHAAGVGQLSALECVGAGEVVSVVEGKVAGAVALDAVFGGGGLDAFVLFSSIAATWGSGSQGVYAAANAHLDALAEQWRAAGRAATSVAWGPWAGGGLVHEGGEEQLRRRGLPVMDPEHALT
ncbi:KR domain-containing protein, partial [Streptomyces sp. TRM70308]|uniref:KR domain-containing protein n=1 Tax=Streptomyces sp. TRM70308 TaxID=3131932 RepID=UPI003D009EE1